MSTNQRVAFATTNGNTITKHFGHVTSYIVADIVDGREQTRTVVEMDRPTAHDRGEGRGHDHDAKLTPIQGCDTVVAGGMGTPMAQRVLAAGFRLILTSETDINSAVSSLIDGTLQHEPELAHAPRH